MGSQAGVRLETGPLEMVLKAPSWLETTASGAAGSRLHDEQFLTSPGHSGIPSLHL